MEIIREPKDFDLPENPKGYFLQVGIQLPGGVRTIGLEVTKCTITNDSIYLETDRARDEEDGGPFVQGVFYDLTKEDKKSQVIKPVWQVNLSTPVPAIWVKTSFQRPA